MICHVFVQFMAGGNFHRFTFMLTVCTFISTMLYIARTLAEMTHLYKVKIPTFCLFVKTGEMYPLNPLLRNYQLIIIGYKIVPRSR